MKRALLSAGSILALCTAAAHADSKSHDWNGWYAGVQLGFSQHTATYEDRDFDWYGSTIDLLSFGTSVGVTGGYNVVSDNVLMGVAADLGALTNSEQTIYSNRVQIQNDANLLASLRGRVGHAVGNTLVYTTAGVAAADFDRSWTEFADAPDSWPDLGDGKLGVTLGFGVEHAINSRFSIAGEFQTAVFNENTSVNDNGFLLGINDRVHRLGLALNYKLGDVGTVGGAQANVPDGSPADFSGAYVGGRLGGAYADLATTDVGYFTNGGTYDVGSTGSVAGVAGGYNWQSGATVLGVEATVTASDLSEDTQGGANVLDTSMDQVVSLRGRAGVAVDDTLIYVTGGLSSADVDQTLNTDTADVSGTYTGLTVGAGVEQFITGNLSWTADATYTIFDGQEQADDPSEVYQGTADLTTVSAGVNYYIGGGDRARGTGALAPSHDWSGRYAGVAVGALANEANVTDVDYFDFGGGIDVVSLGAGVGGHAGYNWQDGSLVYGVVADLAAHTNAETLASARYREISSNIKASGSLRGRAGIATGDSLLFATAGVGFVQSDLAYDYPTFPDESFDLNETRIGAIVGLGVEHAMSDSMSLKIETLYFATGGAEGFQDPLRDCSAGAPDGFDGGNCSMNGADNNLSVTAGVSFAF